ncbi:hypothetical protein FP435_03085 [Lactobacillus sp. PV037]|uniref:hypothetical protein n=1 Tax=unclassified Lactobacillus TaxID=2620435 RepID=UPI00223EF21B|nr:MULTISPECIES: hypothetical protein [unclassified Lactobacillus]QNQ82390.1 hypothetical protein FP433_04740 [Lactobacillus sp. PV012]QNQ83496.1 hypothetical protein FP435_03085 [Lactobacillus sp. PV037]
MSSGQFMLGVLFLTIALGVMLMEISDRFVLKHPTYRRMKEMRAILLVYRDIATIILLPAFLTFFTEIPDISQQLWMMGFMICVLALDWWLIRTLEESYTVEDVNKFIKGN